MKTILTKILFFSVIILLLSCNNEPSLQRYFVDSSEKPAFQSLSFSPQSFIKNAEQLTEEEKAQLENITKLNLLVLQKNDVNKQYDPEIKKVNAILQQKQYKSLFSAGSGNKQMEMFYVGSGSKISEFIVFASSEEDGFVVARILGKDLSPNNIYKIMKLSDKVDMSQIQETLKTFTNDV